MKKLTSVILAVAMALSILGVMAVCIFQKIADGGASPEIVFSDDVLAVSTGADDAALLAGVTATDAEDGDVTDSLVIQGRSGLSADGTVQVTYAAFDSDRHVTKATRTVRYTDYHSPRFTLSQPLICRTNGSRAPVWTIFCAASRAGPSWSRPCSRMRARAQWQSIWRWPWAAGTKTCCSSTWT